MGKNVDIEHDLRAIEGGPFMGTVDVFMSRLRREPPKPEEYGGKLIIVDVWGTTG